MNVLIFGGTGLLGSAAAQIFIDRGHKVKTIALPPLPEGAPIPKEMAKSKFDPKEFIDDTVEDKWYSEKDFHYIYFAEIEKVLISE